MQMGTLVWGMVPTRSWEIGLELSPVIGELEIGSEFGLKIGIWGSGHRGGEGGGSLPQVVCVERTKAEQLGTKSYLGPGRD